MSKIPAKRKAPPPDRPLNVEGSGIHFPSQIKTKTPDWNFWGAMPKATHLQACILSIGIDPDSLRILDRYSIEILPIETQETLKKRLKLLAATRYKTTIFTLPMAQYSGLNTGEVFLSEFAAWGVSLGWDDMPQELAAMAQEQAVIAPKVAPVAEPPPQSASHERFERLLFSELWSEEQLLSIMCGDARRLFGSGPSASDIEREDARGAIWDGMTVESLCVADVRQVESGELMVPPETVRYFKPQQAIAWVNRNRFPKFPFSASEVMPPVSKPQAAPASGPVRPAAELAAEGLTTRQIVEAFAGLVAFKLGKSMTDRAAWTGDARITSGTKGGRYKSRWNPVIMATALHERNKVPMLKLNQAFNTCKFLAAWREEWNRLSTM